MTKGNQAAFPSITVLCGDRERNFCLNHYAFCAIEEHMIEQTGNKEYNVYNDFDWDSLNASKMAVVLWAGFASDAMKDKTPWTVELAKVNIEFVGMTQCGALIQESLERAVPMKDATEDVSKKKITNKKRR